VFVDAKVERADGRKPGPCHGPEQYFAIIFYALLAPKMDDNGTWNITVALFPLAVTSGEESIGFHPPSSEVAEGDIFWLSQTVAVSDSDSPCTGEELHDTESDVLYVQPSDSELVIHVVNINPREKVGFHESPDGCRKGVVFAFRLGHHASVDVVEVKTDHLLLRDVR
jgi:hypothetical protein